jgi:putative toxin-antitoxin system antitoxin component (TIGR02293 family)
MAHAHAIQIRPQNAKVHGQRSSPRGKLGPESVRSLVSAASMAEKGVSKASAAQLFKQIAAASPLPMGKLRAELIPDSSWKRAGKTLGPQASQTVARVRHVLSLSVRVWGNETDAMEWLTGPHPELQGAAPLSILRTEAGGRAVEAILAALEYGFPV